ncbi:MAG TPA: XRE family transcriptional regulator [Phycisphaerales bacterium]|nr:XRE family transcriptional regulator [Phycisphaerales bacterium]
MSRKNGESIQVRIGLRIKELRNQRGLSQEKLAMLADLDRTYINSVENGRRNISINSLAKISAALGYTLQDFFKSDLFGIKNR